MGRLAHLVWACLECRREGSLQRHKRGEQCQHCGTWYRRGAGATVIVEPPGKAPATLTAPEVEDRLPTVGCTGQTRAEFRDFDRDDRLYVFGWYYGRIEKLKPPRPGRLQLDHTTLSFHPDEGPGLAIPLLEITSIQQSEHALQLKVRGRPVFLIKPVGSSPKLWEERLQNAVIEAYKRAGLGEVAEYQPQICATGPKRWGARRFRFADRLRAARNLRGEPTLQYRLCCWIARTGWRFMGGIDVTGVDNIPATGPFICIANHQSFLEPVLIPAVQRRTIWAMAKTGQFNVRLSGWILPRIYAFPVRRFEVDPHALRFMLRRMSEGFGVLVFIEGERTWNGLLQTHRRAIGRLILKAGVPIVPCRVQGAYECWPRWAPGAQRGRIRIAFGKPLDLPAADGPAACEAQLDDTLALIRSQIDPALDTDT